MKLSPQFIVDEKGKEIGVLLPIAEYRRLIEDVEELDAEFAAAIERGLRDKRNKRAFSFEDVFGRPQRG